MAKDISKKISLSPGLNNDHQQANSNEDIFTKQQKLKVSFSYLLNIEKHLCLGRSKNGSCIKCKNGSNAS